MLHQQDIRNSLIHYGLNKMNCTEFTHSYLYLTVHNRVRQSVLEANCERNIKLSFRMRRHSNQRTNGNNSYEPISRGSALDNISLKIQ